MKNNLELEPGSDQYLNILKLVESAVRESKEFNFCAFPRYMTRPIISRYESGMSYPEHVDAPIMGFPAAAKGLAPLGQGYVRSDLSMTIFLSEKESYSGGELCFKADGGNETAIKLAAGSAVVYPTGARHSVAPVSSGYRLAAIFWIQTIFPAEGDRRLVYDSYRLTQMLQARPTSAEYLLARDNYYNLSRLLAEV